MAQGTETAEFKVNLAGNAADVAKTTAGAMSEMRKRIDEGRGALVSMNSELKALKSAKGAATTIGELKAKIDAQKDSLKASSSELKKQSTALRDASKAAKAQTAATAEAKAAIEKQKAEYAKLATERKKISTDNLKERMQADRDSTNALAGAVGGVLVGAMLAVVTAIGAAGFALAKFVLHGADAARSVGLLRQASMNGNAQWGKNFGEQVDALSKKVPTSKEKIDELGKSLALSKIGGQVWVDTLNAVTQASAAVGEQAGGKLKEFIERGRQFNRFQLNPQEMIGTGLEFDDIAKVLGKSMKGGVQAARNALADGSVKLADGAAAMREAVEKKFGGINIKQMLSLSSIVDKLGESLAELVASVDIEPILADLKEMATMFDLSTTSGQALKDMIGIFAKDVGRAFKTAVPYAREFIYGMVEGVIQLTGAYSKVREALRETFGDSTMLKNVDGLKVALTAGKIAVQAIGVALLATAGFVTVAAVPFIALGAVIYGLTKAINATAAAAMDVGRTFVDVGSAMVDGLIEGLENGIGRVREKVSQLAESVKGAFTGKLKIKSPSKVFAEYGKYTTEGFAQGVDAGSDEAQAAVSSMVGVPSAGSAGGQGGSKGGGITVNVGGITIQAGGGNGKEIAAAMSSESVLEQITKAILEAVQGGGIPIPQ
jgi:hypothetical protein